MNRRDFLRRSAILAAGVVAADQLEILERLAPRRLFASIDLAPQQATFAFEQFNGRFTLSECYRRSTTKLYKVYTRPVRELRWMESFEDEAIEADGKFVELPLIADQRSIHKLRLREL